MLSLSDARAEIIARVHAVPAEPVALATAHGRVLREDIAAPEDMPEFDRSAMDGYAFRSDDPNERFRVVAEIQAGEVPAGQINPGECARIFTGAQVPGGADCVIPQEQVKREGEWMLPVRRDGPSFIRQRGEDARVGDLLLSWGSRLGTGELALLAQVGAVQPRVSRALRVAHVVTGGELVPPDQTPGPGQIRDSNSTLVRALIAEAGIADLEQSRCPDDLPVLQARVDEILGAGCDLLLMSGGASVGDYDYGARVLEGAGFEIVFTKMNLRPGKPLIFATKGTTVAFILPGNPLSHFVVFQVAVRLALARLMGVAESWNPIRLPLCSAPPPQTDPRETFWPIRIHSEEGQLVATPLHWQSSGDLRGLVGAHGLLRIAAGSGAVDDQGRGECILLNTPFHA